MRIRAMGQGGFAFAALLVLGTASAHASPPLQSPALLTLVRRVTVAPTPVIAGKPAAITVRAVPGVSCTVRVVNEHGAHDAASALRQRLTANAAGIIQWRWTPHATSSGPVRALLHCTADKLRQDTTAIFEVVAPVVRLTARISGLAHAVHAGSHQVLTVTSIAGARCAVAVSYADGSTDSAASLQVVKAVARGRVTWLWAVPRTAPVGQGYVGAGCWLGAQTVTTMATFTVR